MDIKKQITRKLIQATSDKVELNKQALKMEKIDGRGSKRHWEAVKRSRRKEKQGISVDCLYG